MTRIISAFAHWLSSISKTARKITFVEKNNNKEMDEWMSFCDLILYTVPLAYFTATTLPSLLFLSQVICTRCVFSLCELPAISWIGSLISSRLSLKSHFISKSSLSMQTKIEHPCLKISSSSFWLYFSLHGLTYLKMLLLCLTDDQFHKNNDFCSPSSIPRKAPDISYVLSKY